jgi:hypothetical protein
MLALVQHRLDYPAKSHRVGLSVKDFLTPAAAFPETVLPQRRRRRDYLSGVLARNEISREYQYNRKLFARTAHGYYVLNPALALRVADEWVPVYDRLHPPEIERHLSQRERLEEIVAHQASYAQDPGAAIASLRLGPEA